MVPFWVLSIIQELVFRGPRKGTILLTTTHIYIYIYIHVYNVGRLGGLQKNSGAAQQMQFLPAFLSLVSKEPDLSKQEVQRPKEYGCFCTLGVLLVGVLVTRGLI